MSDYISREELLKDLYSREYTNFQPRDFIALVQYQDKADVRENIHGEWIFDEILDKHYYCSECKSMGVSYWDYCPYCGADMRKGET